ncbi:MAG: hypothetical protein WKG00_37180 [Polyangiaceae bacterium]
MLELSNGVRRGGNGGPGRVLALLALVAVVAMASCSATSEGTGFDNDSTSSGQTPAGVGGSGNAGDGGAPISLGGSGTGGDTTDDGTLTLPTALKCAENDQSLLIIDLRSGWWSGDGGDYHTAVLPHLADARDPVTNAPCNNISIEYHYFISGYTNDCTFTPGAGLQCMTGPLPESLTLDQFIAYFHKPFDQFTQVWILSGSQLDGADLNITATFFVDFVDLLADHCMPMLLAADDCFIDHGNIISQAMGMGSVFQHKQPYCPQFVGVSASEAPTITAATTMEAGTHLSDHLLFTNVSSIADGVTSSSYPMGNPTGDSLLAAEGVTTLATSTSNEAQIGEAFVTLAGEKYPRPVLLDAGWDRSWTALGHPGTGAYMQNLVLYMGLIGCIAEEYVPK